MKRPYLFIILTAVFLRSHVTAIQNRKMLKIKESDETELNRGSNLFLTCSGSTKIPQAMPAG